ncbi:ABC transporter ATP-binding protein [Glaciibacter psychrotolerans]|uniref:Molybdate transport system ATP-binding protein n=1 Tax=Glaciibacter psychrotolerans TaxID=670054 RepID=A0A7Z0EGS7_9MICO|nr:ABC transporter ATP-binding protein [Leifsonia psychrotolerans]NYJ21387.1 molybdate transport system ATP-binding protein [Leifsonia psychrotolerans]
MNTVLDARLRVRRGDFILNAAVRVAAGEVLAVLGPNGSGKTTLLAAVAGLLVPESGAVTVSGRLMTSRTERASLCVPPARRGIGLLGQEPLLFPHLSAVDNVAFGQQAQGMSRRSALSDARGWLDAVGLSGFEDRKPAQLSGGQQQRVAIARALAARPRVLLLDEPMAALDVQNAVAIRQLLREQLTRSGTPAIIVTHDVLDALVLADRAAILHDGRIIDEGPTAQVLGAPRTQFIAALAGLNLVRGTRVRVAGDAGFDAGFDGIRLPDGRILRGHAGRAGHAAVWQGPGPASAVFPPSAVSVSVSVAVSVGFAEPVVDDLLNRWSAIISALEPSSGGIRVRTVDDSGVAAELSAARVAELGLRTGLAVWLSVPVAEVTIFADPPL